MGGPRIGSQTVPNFTPVIVGNESTSQHITHAPGTRATEFAGLPVPRPANEARKAGALAIPNPPSSFGRATLKVLGVGVGGIGVALLFTAGLPFLALGKGLVALKHAVFGKSAHPLFPTEPKPTVTVDGKSVELDPSIFPKKLPKDKPLEKFMGEINQKISDGQKLVADLQAGEIPDRRCTMEDMTNIMWYLQTKSEAKAGNFSSGAMSIADPGHHLRNFLDSCPEAYQRISSHVKVFQNQDGGQHRGIDADGSAKKMDELLPYGRQALLYGALNKGGSMPEDRLWLKIESHGSMLCPPSGGDKATGPSRNIRGFHDFGALVGHTMSFVLSRGQGSAKGTRKERVPKDVTKSFNTLVTSFKTNHPGIAGALQSGIPKKDDSEGLRTMHNNAKKALLLTQDPNEQAKIQEFIRSIESNYDNLHVRIGNEVIL